jgi:SNF2 family DNA or RNA helicase
MTDHDRKLYNAAREAIVLDSTGANMNLMNRLTPLQLICNNPLTLVKSQSMIAQFLVQSHKITDQYCAKLSKLEDLLGNIDGKVVIFSRFNELGMHMLAPYLARWGHTFVVYDGNKKQMQAAQDRFRLDKRVKVFLSSDQGSDSIDLEQATTVINYDLPHNDSTLLQRVNRISRLTSEADHVFYINLLMVKTLEEKNLKRLEYKRGLEEAMSGPLKDQSELITHGNFDSLEFMLDL